MPRSALQVQRNDTEGQQDQDAEAFQPPATSGSSTPAKEEKRIVIPCPAAIVIALAQAEVMSGVGWYTSTNELNLASLGCCIACRRVPTVARVRVDGETPLNLLMDRISRKQYQKNPVKTGVPSISYSALRELVWELPVRFLSLMTEVFNRLECVTVYDNFYDSPIANTRFPPNVKVLRLKGHFNRTMKEVSFPIGLQELELGNKFNQNLAGVQWPPSLQRLSLGHRFNRPVRGIALPQSLRYLSFGENFNQVVTKVAWPTHLQELSFSRVFNQSIAGISWPRSLTKLTFGFRFNQPVDTVSWPGMVELTFGYHFNHPVQDVSWPASLKTLTFGKMFTQTTLPSSLKHLTILRPGTKLPECPGEKMSGVSS